MTSAPGNQRPGRLVRFLFRLPRLIYDAGLGGAERWLGLEWIELTTTGRKSGQPRVVLLDLIGEDAARGRFFVQSAYGRRSDWVRNLEKNRRCEVQVGRRRHHARAIEVSGEEAEHVMLAYVRRHPTYSPLVARIMGYRGARRDEAVAAWLLDRFGMVGFEVERS